MAEIVSCEWLLAHVGKPTNSFGSKYSSLYKAMEVYEKARTSGNLTKVGTIAMEWCQSKHKNAATAEARDLKQQQQLHLNRFIGYLTVELKALNPLHKTAMLVKMKTDDANYPKEKAIIEQVILEMASSPVAILANTARFLTGKPVVMQNSETVNGAMSGGGTLTINPVLAYNHSELRGVIVHECHHYLCLHNGNHTYIDEFVAHVKQFTLTRPAMSEAVMVDTVNRVLKAGYGSIVARWIKPVAQHGMGMRLVETFADLGDFAVLDNAAVKAKSSLKHGCAPA